MTTKKPATKARKTKVPAKKLAPIPKAQKFTGTTRIDALLWRLRTHPHASPDMKSHRAAEMMSRSPRYDGLVFGFGYLVAAEQQALALRLYRDSDIVAIARDVEEVAPHVARVDGRRVFQLYTADAGESGSYDFVLLDDGSVEIDFARYSREKVVHRAESVVAGLEYVSAHLYCIDYGNEDEDREDVNDDDD